jgi:hypothetical protein
LLETVLKTVVLVAVEMAITCSEVAPGLQGRVLMAVELMVALLVVAVALLLLAVTDTVQ